MYPRAQPYRRGVGAAMAEAVLSHPGSTDAIEDALARTARVRAASGRCPACGVPQGPFAPRRGRTVTCLACDALYDDDGTVLWSPRSVH